MTKYLSQFEQLKSAHAQQRLSHAYLLSGMGGLGKTAFAREFAHYLLGAELETHPDFIFIAPQEKSRAIKVDQIRELSDKLSRTAHKGGYQVVIISPADAMPTAAANALLKTLEEPQGQVVIFLIDDQAYFLPKTIASRCQKIIFYPDTQENGMQGCDDKLQKAIFSHIQSVILKRVNPISVVSEWSKQDLSVLLNGVIASLITLSKAHYEDSNPLKKIAVHISPEKLHEVLALVCQKKQYVSEGINLNTQLCLEGIFIALC